MEIKQFITEWGKEEINKKFLELNEKTTKLLQHIKGSSKREI